jgi:pimeloyl-ACP methyl ester carboxylesterase
MPKVNANGIELYYEASGAGEPLIFIPGLGVSAELWSLQTKFFQSEYFTVSYDLRGAGRSSKPEGPYTMDQMAKDLNGLLDALEIDQPVNLVGASMGGIIAQAFIHEYPQRVKRLVLACTGVSVGDPHITYPPQFVTDKLANPGTTPEQKVDTFLQISYHPSFVAAHPELKQFLLSGRVEPQPAYAYRAQLAACADARPYYQWLREIAVPVLVIHGDDDLIWPLQNAKTLMQGIGDRAELVVLPKAGHVFMQEQPAQFNQALREFLRKPS